MIRESAGRQGEDRIARIAGEALFYDFVYKRPYYRLGRRQKELCDILAILDEQALIIQIKAWGGSGIRTAEHELRWLQREGLRAARQLQGACRVLTQQRSLTITAPNPILGNVTFPSGTFAVRHGIAVLDVTLSGSRIPENAPHLSKRGMHIHYLSFDDLMGLLRHLRTFVDLLDYLDERATLAVAARPALNAERDLYAYFITHARKLSSLHSDSEIRGYWDSLTSTHGATFARKLAEDDHGALIDQMIAYAHVYDASASRAVPAGPAPTPEETRQTYLEVVQELNRLSLGERREIAKVIESLAQTSVTDGRPHYFATVGRERRTVFVFLVSGLPRPARAAALEKLVLAAMALHGIARGVGVGLPNELPTAPAFTYTLIHGQSQPDPELRQRATRWFNPNHDAVIWSDFPDQTSPPTGGS